MNDRLNYPMIFSKEPNSVSIRFPDIYGLIIHAPLVETAFNTARYALHLHVQMVERTKAVIPKETTIVSVPCRPNEFVGMMVYDCSKPNSHYTDYIEMPKWLKDIFAKDTVNLTDEIRKAQRQYPDEPF